MENCSHARRFLLYSDVVVILKSTVGTRRLHRNARMQRNDFQSSSSFDKNRESRSENLMPLQIGIIPERVLEGETGTNKFIIVVIFRFLYKNLAKSGVFRERGNHVPGSTYAAGFICSLSSRSFSMGRKIRPDCRKRRSGVRLYGGER